MADRAPRQTVPADINPLDEAVYEPGTPTSSWLGREIGKNLRWLDHNLTRRLGEAYVQNHATVDTPTIRNAGGEVIGPFTHWGTPGVVEGEWYARLSFGNGKKVTIAPFAISPDILPIHPPILAGILGEQILTGTGAAANFGPIKTPLREGPCRVGLLLTPAMAAANDDTGTVEWCDGSTMCSTLGDFVALTPPYPLICLYDAGGMLSAWTQILEVHQTISAGDTVCTQEPLVQPGLVYGQSSKPGIGWATRYAETVTVLSVYLREVRS
jgi:hypothetical protein